VRALGVGLVYWAALEELFGPGGPDLGVLELEPQTLWEKTCIDGVWQYRSNEALLDRVAELRQAKLLHGVGHPVGGTIADPIDPVPALCHAVRRLDPVWVSEHLSYNRILRGQEIEHAGFLLPPPQSPAAVRVAASNIDRLRRALDRPVAFETGVNYLQPHCDELDDGAYFAAVAEASGSGIVLDLHNLWCNQVNGRQSMAQALAQLPLERVWEIHFAGGMKHGRYWLDAHSGGIPDEVIDVAAGLIPRLSRLGALVFEILPEHLANLGLDGVRMQIERLHGLWRLRPPQMLAVPHWGHCNAVATSQDLAEVAAREKALVEAIGARADAGCRLYRELIADFRKANLARALRYTLTALLAGLGARGANELIEAYFELQPPEPFAALEADTFAQFLRAHVFDLAAIPHFEEVLAFEHALVRATSHGESCEVVWTADPVQLFDALDAGILPRDLIAQTSTLRICAH
jgi:uncharacterized protein (UPF0276 family)